MVSDLKRNERRRLGLEHVGHAVWRVLQNARKAAKARENKTDDGKQRPAVFKVADGEAPALPPASVTSANRTRLKI